MTGSPDNTLPTGTVTFLFTDVEGSTQRWESHHDAMKQALSQHNAIMREAIAADHGMVFETAGDSFVAVFSSAPDALRAALDAQRELHAATWTEPVGRLKVRMALHTGHAEMRPDGYYAQHTLSRLARILAAGHGDQVLISLATHELVRDALPPEVELLDLGEHRLKDLIRPEEIYQMVVEGLPANFPPLKTLDNRSHNLPAQATPFIGREHEIARVGELLRGSGVRLLTLTGPGGTGKTRLSLQVAAEMLEVEDFADGVYFVDLSTLSNPALVPSAIAQALGVTESADRPLIDRLKEYLKEKRLLLVLDNFEQILEAGVSVDALLKAAPRLRVLATSRVPLRIYGGKEYPVPAMTLPDVTSLPPLESLTRYEAVRLFVERARDVKPDFEVTHDNALAVAEICVRLDGLPLAIELAAARVRLFSPPALLSRLQSRLKFLTGGAQSLPARQQTLRNAIEWSHDLLSDEEKVLYRRLGVFTGGFTLDAAEAICSPQGSLQIDSLEGVTSLFEKSLLRQEEGVGGEPRFVMLETIHEYAREKLEESAEAEEMRRRHALYFAHLAEEAEAELSGAREVQWLDRLEEQHDNFRAAIEWSQVEAGKLDDAGRLAGLEIGLRIGGALQRFWDMRGHFTEGRERLRQLLSHAESFGPAASGARARALITAGRLAWHQGDLPEARSLYEESLAISRQLGDKLGMTYSFNGLGNVARMQGDDSAADSFYEQSLKLARELGDKGRTASALQNLGSSALGRSDYDRARELYEESLMLLRELGDRQGAGVGLFGLGVVALSQGDHNRAWRLFEESLAPYREAGNEAYLSVSRFGLGQVAHAQGEYARAASLFKESLIAAHKLRDKIVANLALAGLAAVASGEGKPERAARLFGASDAMFETTGFRWFPIDHTLFDQGKAAAHAQVGEEQWQKAWEEGQALSMEQAVAYALEES